MQRRQHVLADVHARDRAGAVVSTPVLCSTIVFTRGSFATCSACRPPQLQPEYATSAGSMRPKNGLPDRSFSASAQSIASVRSDAFVRGGRIWPGLRRGTRLSRRSARAAQDAAARDHEIAVRGDLEQMQPAARAVVGTSAVAPGHDAQLHGAKRGEILRAVDDVPRQGRDFLFHRGETPGARRVGPIVVVGGLLCGRSGGRGDEHERGQERARHSAADVMTGHARQYRM